MKKKCNNEYDCNDYEGNWTEDCIDLGNDFSEIKLEYPTDKKRDKNGK